MSRFLYPLNIHNAHKLAIKDLYYNFQTAVAHDLVSSKTSLSLGSFKTLFNFITSETLRTGRYQFDDAKDFLSSILDINTTAKVSPESHFVSLLVELIYWSDMTGKAKYDALKAALKNSSLPINARAYSHLLLLKCQIQDPLSYCINHRNCNLYTRRLVGQQILNSEQPTITLSPFHGVGAGHAYSYYIVAALASLIKKPLNVAFIVDSPTSINIASELYFSKIPGIFLVEYQQLDELGIASLATMYTTDSLFSIRNHLSIYNVLSCLGVSESTFHLQLQAFSENPRTSTLIHLKVPGFKQVANENQQLRSLDCEVASNICTHLSQRYPDALFLGAGNDTQTYSSLPVNVNIVQNDIESTEQLALIHDAKSFIGMQSGVSHYASALASDCLRLNMLSFEPDFFVTPRHLYAFQRLLPQPPWFKLSVEHRISILLSDISATQLTFLLQIKALTSLDLEDACIDYDLMISTGKATYLYDVLSNICTMPKDYPNRMIARSTQKDLANLFVDFVA